MQLALCSFDFSLEYNTAGVHELNSHSLKYLSCLSAPKMWDTSKYEVGSRLVDVGSWDVGSLVDVNNMRASRAPPAADSAVSVHSLATL